MWDLESVDNYHPGNPDWHAPVIPGSAPFLSYHERDTWKQQISALLKILNETAPDASVTTTVDRHKALVRETTGVCPEGDQVPTDNTPNIQNNQYSKVPEEYNTKCPWSQNTYINIAASFFKEDSCQLRMFIQWVWAVSIWAEYIIADLDNKRSWDASISRSIFYKTIKVTTAVLNGRNVLENSRFMEKMMPIIIDTVSAWTINTQLESKLG